MISDPTRGGANQLSLAMNRPDRRATLEGRTSSCCTCNTNLSWPVQAPNAHSENGGGLSMNRYSVARTDCLLCRRMAVCRVFKRLPTTSRRYGAARPSRNQRSADSHVRESPTGGSNARTRLSALRELSRPATNWTDTDRLSVRATGGHHLGSWSQSAAQTPWGLSMNLGATMSSRSDG